LRKKELREEKLENFQLVGFSFDPKGKRRIQKTKPSLEQKIE
jgi:hypothetical protein